MFDLGSLVGRPLQRCYAVSAYKGAKESSLGYRWCIATAPTVGATSRRFSVNFDRIWVHNIVGGQSDVYSNRAVSSGSDRIAVMPNLPMPLGGGGLASRPVPNSAASAATTRPAMHAAKV
jgi:hypothetical protein